MIKNKRIALCICFLIMSLFITACQGSQKDTIEEPLIESALEDEGEVINVTNTEEFLAAIGPDRTIKVAPGEYDLLSTNSDNEYIKYEETFDGMQIIIYKASNLKIIGDEDNKAEFVIEPRYSNVLVFKDVDNLTIKNIVAGHKKNLGECSGGVFQFSYCDDVILENLDLYGCGTIGIDLKDSERFKIINPNIYECNYNAFRIENSSDIEVFGGRIFDNKVFTALIEVLNSKQIVFNETVFDNNKSHEIDGYESYDYFVMNESESPIRFNNCIIKNNNLEYFFYKKDQYTDCIVKDNKFKVDTDVNGIYNNTYNKKEESWYEIKVKESTDWISSADKSNKENIRKKALMTYEKLIEDLGIFDLNGVPTAITSFKKMTKLIDDKSITDELVAILLEYYRNYTDVASYSMFTYKELNDIYSDENTLGFISLDKIKDEKLKLKVESSIKSGIELNSFYENIFMSESKGFIVSKVGLSISEGLLKYLELRDQENVDESSQYENAEVNESEDMYANYYYKEIDKLVKWEKFYKDNPKILKNSRFTNYLDRYEFSLKQPFENIKQSVAEDYFLYQNDLYMISALDMLFYERLFELYPYSSYTQKYKKIINSVKQHNNIITLDIKDDLVKSGLIEANVNYDSYFKNADDYYKLISKFRSDLSKFKAEIKESPKSNIETSLKTVNVDNIYNMFDEIGSNKKIVMKSGVYKVGVSFLKYVDDLNMQNTIINVKNLTIESSSEEPVILLLDYGVVLKFDTCENILLSNFIIGHSTEICNGNVIEVVNSKNININNSLLYGSGYIGLYVEKSEDIILNRSLITDTTTNPVSIIDSKNIEIKNSRIYENYVPYIFDIDNSNDVRIKSSQIIYNSYQEDSPKKGMQMIKMDNVDNIVVENSYFIDNKFDEIYANEYDDFVRFTGNITN